MRRKQNPIAKELRTPKYRKRVVESKKYKTKRKFREVEDWIEENAPYRPKDWMDFSDV
jgi:hypothetical protein